jgi:hypothetical protein
LPAPNSQTSTIRTQPPPSDSRNSLPVRERNAPKTSHPHRSIPSLREVFNFCKRQMNSTCGKTIRHPRIKPVIAGDTICGSYLLTRTISGSNFAIP